MSQQKKKSCTFLFSLHSGSRIFKILVCAHIKPQELLRDRQKIFEDRCSGIDTQFKEIYVTVNCCWKTLMTTTSTTYNTFPASTVTATTLTPPRFCILLALAALLLERSTARAYTVQNIDILHVYNVKTVQKFMNFL